MSLSGESLRLIGPLLWDTDHAKIDLGRDKRAIMERILVYGRPEHIRWMNAQYTQEEIAAVVSSSRNIDGRTANHRSIHFCIPKANIRCFSKHPESFFYFTEAEESLDPVTIHDVTWEQVKRYFLENERLISESFFNL
jgi:hypothetical protein